MAELTALHFIDRCSDVIFSEKTNHHAPALCPHFWLETESRFLSEKDAGDSYAKTWAEAPRRKFWEMRRAADHRPPRIGAFALQISLSTHTESAPQRHIVCVLRVGVSVPAEANRAPTPLPSPRADNDAATCHAIFFSKRRETCTRFIDYLFIELDVFGERLLPHRKVYGGL
jgi:hypothetical protein